MTAESVRTTAAAASLLPRPGETGALSRAGARSRQPARRPVPLIVPRRPGRACPGHPRRTGPQGAPNGCGPLRDRSGRGTAWVPGTGPGMTGESVRTTAAAAAMPPRPGETDAVLCRSAVPTACPEARPPQRSAPSWPGLSRPPHAGPGRWAHRTAAAPSETGPAAARRGCPGQKGPGMTAERVRTTAAAAAMPPPRPGETDAVLCRSAVSTACPDARPSSCRAVLAGGLSRPPTPDRAADRTGRLRPSPGPVRPAAGRGCPGQARA